MFLGGSLKCPLVGATDSDAQWEVGEQGNAGIDHL